MRFGRNEPCRCGSGRKYKHCHLAIDEASPEHRYEAAQKVYARNWALTAQAHHKARRYHWMAERLKPLAPRRILDIGCGSGHGLLALFEVLEKELQIVSADENGTCLEIAAETLSRAGIAANVVKRLEAVLTPEGFAFNAAPVMAGLDGRCTLIESDICNDPELINALVSGVPFDAVTIWLTGTHMLRQSHRDVRSRGIDSDGAHRLYVQNNVYTLADCVLRSGGMLQVVDRTEAPTTDELREDFLNAHRDQASVTGLQVTDIEYLLYEEAQVKRTPMVFTPGTSGRIPTQLQTAITSIVSLKS